jgi:hypothetical protein
MIMTNLFQIIATHKKSKAVTLSPYCWPKQEALRRAYQADGWFPLGNHKVIPADVDAKPFIRRDYDEQ